jgi:urease accessory protein
MTAHRAVPVPHQRSQGLADVSLALRDGRTGLVRLRQQGSAKAILPHAGDLPEVVFLNTSGGLTAGDRLHYGLTLGPGCRAVATTQTAERAYRAEQGRAEVTVRLSVGPGGHLDWLPQETILFDHAALNRRTEIALEGPASGCLLLEAVVLGRAAMGETLARVWLHDRRSVLRDGQPQHLEALLVDDAALTGGAAVLGGARAAASIALLCRGAEDALAAVRAVPLAEGVQAAASALDGRLVLRLLAVDGWPMRGQIRRFLEVLRRRALPRVWQM